MIELVRTLGALTDPPAEGHAALAELLDLGALPSPSEHTDLFLFQLPPFASIYLGPEGKLGGEGRDRVAGFWRAVGQSPPAEPDHLGALLGLYAGLSELEADEGDDAHRVLLAQSASALLHEHVLSWTGPYLASVAELSNGFYRRWAELLQETLRVEREARTVPQHLSVHLRQAPPLPDPRAEGGSAFLDGLLAPACSGLIVTRAALARGAAACRVGIRAGERRYALEAMLAQDGARVLGWLASEGHRWVERHQGLAAAVGETSAAHWSERAAQTAALLESLADAAWEEAPCPR